MNYRQLQLLPLLFFSPFQAIVAWQNGASNQLPDHGPPTSSILSHAQPSAPCSRKDFFVAGLTKTSTVALVGGSFTLPLASATAVTTESSLSDEILQSLRPATTQRPAISLSSPGIKDPTPVLPSPTIISALVNVQNPQIRPSPGELLVIQVWAAPPSDGLHTKGSLLGGAKIPVSLIRFPVQIQLTVDNALLDRKDSWTDFATRADLYLTATVCATSADERVESNHDTSRPSICAKEPSFEAMGVSKLLTELPGLEKASIPYGVRPPATLNLRAVINRGPESSGKE